jgi:hypothetical protein
MAEPDVRPGTTSLADLLDRVVDKGVVITGDVVLSLAGIDLIRLDLRLLLIGVQTAADLALEEGIR